MIRKKFLKLNVSDNNSFTYFKIFFSLAEGEKGVITHKSAVILFQNFTNITLSRREIYYYLEEIDPHYNNQLTLKDVYRLYLKCIYIILLVICERNSVCDMFRWIKLKFFHKTIDKGFVKYNLFMI